MVNGFRYYRALESVSILASALFTALTIYPCQISASINADSLNSNFLQLGRSGGRPQPAVHPTRLPVNVIHTTLVGLEPATFRSLVRRATSSATEPTKYVPISCQYKPPLYLAPFGRNLQSKFWLGIVSPQCGKWAVVGAWTVDMGPLSSPAPHNNHLP